MEKNKASIQLTNRGQVVGERDEINENEDKRPQALYSSLSFAANLAGISSWSSMRQRRGRKSANHNPPFEWIITDTDQVD
jgi:hypothetical protein